MSRLSSGVEIIGDWPRPSLSRAPKRTATEASLSLLLCSQRLLGTLMTAYDFPWIDFAEFN